MCPAAQHREAQHPPWPCASCCLCSCWLLLSCSTRLKVRAVGNVGQESGLGLGLCIECGGPESKGWWCGAGGCLGVWVGWQHPKLGGKAGKRAHSCFPHSSSAGVALCVTYCCSGALGSRVPMLILVPQHHSPALLRGRDRSSWMEGRCF